MEKRMTPYATKAETESVMHKATPFERWLNSELDRLAPDRYEMGEVDDGMLKLLEQIWIERGRP